MVFAMSGAARADTVTYNFNDGTLDGLVPGSVPSGFSYTFSGGSLNVSEASGVGNGGIVFQTPFDISVDFTATVYAARNNPANGGDFVIHAQLGSSFTGDTFLAGANSIYSVVTGPTYTGNGASDSSTSATLSINRTGDTVTTSYTDSSGTTVLQSKTDPSLLGSTAITIFFDQELGNTAAQSGSFDNLTITSDSIVAAPLPSSVWGGLCPLGLLGMGTLLRRRRTQCI